MLVFWKTDSTPTIHKQSPINKKLRY